MFLITYYVKFIYKKKLSSGRNVATNWSMPCFGNDLVGLTTIHLSNAWQAKYREYIWTLMHFCYVWSGFLKLLQVAMDIFTFESSSNLCLQSRFFQVLAEHVNMIITHYILRKLIMMEPITSERVVCAVGHCFIKCCEETQNNCWKMGPYAHTQVRTQNDWLKFLEFHWNVKGYVGQTFCWA